MWHEVIDVGIIPYLDRLHGPSPLLTETFVSRWKKGSLRAYGTSYQIDETLVVTVTGLAKTDIRFYRDRKIGEEDLMSFFDKDKELSRVTKMADGGYNRKDLMVP